MPSITTQLTPQPPECNEEAVGWQCGCVGCDCVGCDSVVCPPCDVCPRAFVIVVIDISLYKGKSVKQQQPNTKK